MYENILVLQHPFPPNKYVLLVIIERVNTIYKINNSTEFCKYVLTEIRFSKRFIYLHFNVRVRSNAQIQYVRSGTQQIERETQHCL